MAAATPSLRSVTPYRLLVDPAGKAQKIEISGSEFENQGHPNRDEYMHWQLHRSGEGWEPCTQWSSRPDAICRGTGWSGDLQSLEIGGKYITKEGFIELRLSSGLADERDMNPPNSIYKQASAWSNVIRVPVVTPAKPPAITSVSKKEFPTNGKPDDYRFFIEATNLGTQPVVVFRGDTTVWPERVDGGSKIQVSVPQNYRLTAPGEIPFTVRTDKGGESTMTYIRFVTPPKLVPLPSGAGAIKSNLPLQRK